jgi:acetyl-CoA acetyltransferase
LKASDLSGEAAIIGVGYNFVTKSFGEARTSGVELQTKACVRAIKDAGLEPRQIEGLFTGRPPNESIDPQWNMIMVDSLRIAPRATTSVTTHGAGNLSQLKHAALAVCSGQIDYALCSSGSSAPLWMDSVQANSFIEADGQFEAPFSPITPALYAQWASRYMYEYDITPSDAARVAVEHRKWALQHPRAAMRAKGPLTEDDVLGSRLIASPFHLLDCAPWYPGGLGLAFVVTRSDLAREHTDKPIYLRGFGECTTHESIVGRLLLDDGPPALGGANLTTSGAAVAAADAYDMAGWTSADVDIVQTQAPFSYLILMALEDLGFCEKGDAGKFVRSGGIDYDGGLPVNTSGGMLSFGQPNNANPLSLEAVQQLRNEAMGQQVGGARNALVHFHGGPFGTHAVVLLSADRGGAGDS